MLNVYTLHLDNQFILYIHLNTLNGSLRLRKHEKMITEMLAHQTHR